jgi:hypothetical protein
MTNFVLKRNNVAKKVLIYIVGKLDHRGCFMSIKRKKANLILGMVLSITSYNEHRFSRWSEGSY